MARVEQVVLGSVYEAPMPAVNADELRAALASCNCQGVARSGELWVRISARALASVEKTCGAVSPLSCAGVLLGTVYQAGGTWLVEIKEAVPFRTTPEMHRVRVPRHAWQEVLRHRNAASPQARIVGWYHSRPGLGGRFSETDSFVHRYFFPADWQVACVVDPERRDIQFFSRRGRNVLPLGAYWVERGSSSGVATSQVAADLAAAGASKPATPPLKPGSAENAARIPIGSGEEALPAQTAFVGETGGMWGRAQKPPVPAHDPPGRTPTQKNGGKSPVPQADLQDPQQSSETYLKERFVERSLEKILKTLKEPRVNTREYVMMALIVVLIVVVIMTRPATNADLRDVTQKLDRIATRMDGSREAAPAENGAADGTAPQALTAPAEGQPDLAHVMQKGETLWTVAEQYYGDGTQMNALMHYNRIKDARDVRAGTSIRIPSRKQLAESFPRRLPATVSGKKVPAGGEPPAPTPH